MSDQKSLDEVYRDRNVLALALAACVSDLHDQLPEDEAHEYGACWQPDVGDDADAQEWAVVYVWLPAGQASWHVPREMAERSRLPRQYASWDGHDRHEKNHRLLDHAEEKPR